MSFTLSDARALAGLAKEAGDIILRIRKEHLSKEKDWAHAAKEDGSPVTRADKEAEAHILSGIEKLGLSAPVVAEETASVADVKGASGFYLIDPLDGTKAFVGGGDDFCVNIGFIEKGVPTLGVLHAPATGESCFTEGKTAWFRFEDGGEEPMYVTPPGSEGLEVIVNRTEDWSGRLKDYLATLKVREVARKSSAWKLGLLAKGAYHLYPRFGGSYEWDIAAGHAVLLAAGGSLKTLDGKSMSYGKPNFLNPPFIASWEK